MPPSGSAPPSGSMPEAVQVWLIGSELSERALAQLEALLDDRERRRVEQMPLLVNRRRFTAAHGAARVIIGHHLGVPARDIVWEYGQNGKPEVARGAGLHVNLSHSGELALLAITRGRTVGVDVQSTDAGLDAAALSTRFYLPEEARYVTTADAPAGQVSRFVRLWARKEACVKAAGGRMTQGLRLPVRGAGATGRGAGAGIVVSDPGGALPGPYLVRDVPVPQGFRAAVAVVDSVPYRVIRHLWSPQS